MQPPFRPRARRRAGAAFPSGRDRTTSSRRPDRAALDAEHARRADRLAVEPTGTVGRRTTRCARIAAAVAARGGQLVVDEIYLGLTLRRSRRRAACLEFADDAFVISSFSKYFNMTGWRLGWLVAPERHVRDLEKLAQNLYISPADAVAARGAGLLRAGDARDPRRAAARVRGAPRFPGARAARTRVSRFPVMPTGGFFVYADCSRVRDDSEAVLPRRARSHAAWHSRRASTSGATAPAARALRLHDRRRRSSKTASRGSRAICLRTMTADARRSWSRV